MYIMKLFLLKIYLTSYSNSLCACEYRVASYLSDFMFVCQRKLSKNQFKFLMTYDLHYNLTGKGRYAVRIAYDVNGARSNQNIITLTNMHNNRAN